jgi:glyoxylase-like metal-dependent hydrolase (beta-lactamase superfamily II)
VLPCDGVTVLALDTPTLGDRSYLVHDGEVAFVVDPQCDIDRVLALLDEHRLRLTDVFETHIHNDYVTGGFALAQQTGAAYHINAADGVGFEHTPIRDGQAVRIGARMRVTAVPT